MNTRFLTQDLESKMSTLSLRKPLKMNADATSASRPLPYEYLKFLCDRLGEFGKYEFLKRLDISPQEAGEASTEVREKAINLAGRKISRGMRIVDLYAFSMQVSNLLKISRVVRYGSLES